MVQWHSFVVKLLGTPSTVLSALDLLEGGVILLLVAVLKYIWPQNLLSVKHLAGLLVLFSTHFKKYCIRFLKKCYWSVFDLQCCASFRCAAK